MPTQWAMPIQSCRRCRYGHVGDAYIKPCLAAPIETQDEHPLGLQPPGCCQPRGGRETSTRKALAANRIYGGTCSDTRWARATAPCRKLSGRLWGKYYARPCRCTAEGAHQFAAYEFREGAGDERREAGNHHQRSNRELSLRHVHRHVYRRAYRHAPGMCRVPLESSRRGRHFEYRHVYTRAIAMPSAMADEAREGGPR